jgi:hypothetical protein
MIRVTIFQIKFIHTVIFWILTGCIVFAFWSGAMNRISNWTLVAIAAVILEGIALLLFKGKCPLTVLAERMGAEHGSVADIFLPKWFSDRLFPICGTTFIVACGLVVYRLWQA